jgi:hypothetical protein
MKTNKEIHLRKFKSQMENDFIPFIKKLIEREENHLNYLNYLLECKRRIPEHENFIDNSRLSLEHLQMRLKQYIDYYKTV